MNWVLFMTNRDKKMKNIPTSFSAEDYRKKKPQRQGSALRRFPPL